MEIKPGTTYIADTAKVVVYGVTPWDAPIPKGLDEIESALRERVERVYREVESTGEIDSHKCIDGSDACMSAVFVVAAGTNDGRYPLGVWLFPDENKLIAARIYQDTELFLPSVAMAFRSAAPV